MKKIIASAITFVSATAATAGSVTYTPPIATMIDEPAHIGGSGAWLIPLIIVAVLVLAITKKDAAPAANAAR